jgi:branched-chain amino acid transport system permease protein
MSPAFIAQLLANGIVLGMIYALLSVGLALIFGVLGIVNFAHGEFYMLGAMTMALLTSAIGFTYWPGLAASVATAVILGWIVYDLLLAKLGGDDFERSLLGTMGLSMVLQNGAIFLWTGNARMVDTTYGLTSLSIGPVHLSLVRFVALLIGTAAFMLTFVLLYWTRIGQAMRAIAQNREAAMMVGIKPRAVCRMAVIVGIALGGAAGAALAPVYGANPLMGTAIVFKAFAIVIIGGLGSVLGAGITAMGLGIAESIIGGFSTIVV